jgi:hypothetical protein
MLVKAEARIDHCTLTPAISKEANDNNSCGDGKARCGTRLRRIDSIRGVSESVLGLSVTVATMISSSLCRLSGNMARGGHTILLYSTVPDWHGALPILNRLLFLTDSVAGTVIHRFADDKPGFPRPPSSPCNAILSPIGYGLRLEH